MVSIIVLWLCMKRVSEIGAIDLGFVLPMYS